MKDKCSRGKKFAKRAYPPRIVAYGLGLVCIAAVLYQNNANPIVWTYSLLNGLLWPHIAFIRTKLSENTYRAERSNFLCDAFWAGTWLPIIEFNLLPSYGILAMTGIGVVAAGGGKLFLNGLVMIAVGIAVAALFVGISFNYHSSATIIYFTLPYIVVFPLLVGFTTYALSRRLGEQKKQLERLRRTDTLSGLYNRLYWEDLVAAEFRRFQRLGTRSSVILLDVDNFRTINGHFGHIVGDNIIRSIGTVILENLRDIDLAGRYGGEEFGAVLPDADGEAALQIAERLRRNIENNSVPGDLDITFTVSVGVAEVTSNLQNYSQWLEKADGALYRAKLRGRNRTVVANSLLTELN